MGEVYRAKDTRLDRIVAIKVLPSHLSSDADLKQRFEREARAISSLNHAHICALYDIGHQDDVDYLVMEHIEGETLGSRLQKGPLPTPDLLRYSIQIADALDKAHRQGIVHRDLKPGNIMIGKSGVKLLDFGLAKLQERSAPADVSSLQTAPGEVTKEGSILGTLQYMSPEQLEGRGTDARSDIFSFGAVLYEMATGHRAFPGNSQASVIAAILKEEPRPISQAQPLSPPGLERVVKACLVKDPDERMQSAHDIKTELNWIAEGGSQTGATEPVVATRSRRERFAWIVATVATMALAGLAALALPGLMRRPTPPPPTRFAVTAPPDTTLSDDPAQSAISPDGRLLVFVALDPSGASHLWIRPLESLTAQSLEGTDEAFYPFWSPDSRSVGFFADGKLKKVSAVGGTPEVLCEAVDARGGSWNKDGVILFAPTPAGSIYRVSADGGDPVEVLQPDATLHETSLRWPEFLPDGKHFLVVSLPPRQGNLDIYVGNMDTKERTRLLSSSAAPVCAGPEHLILVRNGRLMAQTFDPRGLKTIGDPIPIGEAPLLTGPQGEPAVSASTNGILAHPPAGLLNTQLVWLDRSGTEQGKVPMPAGRYEGLCLSPDTGKLVVERRSSSSGTDLWMVDLTRNISTRFTFISAPSTNNPQFSPDSNWVAFNSNPNGPYDIYRKRANGAGEEELLLHSNAPFKNLMDWSPDGKYLVFNQLDPATGWDIWLLPLEGDRKPLPYLHSRFNEQRGSISPDGHWISYSSDESGRYEIYVQSFPEPGDKYRVSTAGGFVSYWSKDGKELEFGGPDFVASMADVQTAPTFKAGVPRALFKMRQDVLGVTRTPDIQRFLVSVPVGAAAPNSITVELNWNSALKK